MRNGIAKVNGTGLYYEAMGEGHPLVFISGGGSLDRRMWDDQFESFAKDYNVIRYDIRGIGKSEKPERPFSHADDLHALLEFLNIGKAHIMGLSFGGGVRQRKFGRVLNNAPAGPGYQKNVAALLAELSLLILSLNILRWWTHWFWQGRA